MIPRHRPPFNAAALLGTVARSVSGGHDVTELEQSYQQYLNVKHAVWIPSARYGMTHAIRFHLPGDAEVVCPVFNCGAVHHAVEECGRPVRFRDCAADSFLMDCGGTVSGGHGVILSEMFGRRFSPRDLIQPLVSAAALRIFDMAMAIPTAADMARMRSSDLTVISFGPGKSLYAGWGGMALTFCDATAEMLRRGRTRDFTRASWLARCRWNTTAALRTLAHEPAAYGILRSRQRNRRDHTSDHSSFSVDSHEWHRPPTTFHITRSLENLKHADAFTLQRMQLCQQYQTLLSRVMPVADQPPTALSHFCIRVSRDIRSSVRQCLWDNGIDVGTLFPFPDHTVSSESFPHASQAAAEVLNLPLSNQLGRKCITRICEAVEAALDANRDDTTWSNAGRAA